VNADARFIIYSDNEKLGELLISHGSLDWWPARGRPGSSALGGVRPPHGGAAGNRP
jgi:hypothetical protein